MYIRLSSEAWGEEADPAPPQPLQPPGSWEDRAGGDGSQVLPEWLPQLWAVVAKYIFIREVKWFLEQLGKDYYYSLEKKISFYFYGSIHAHR